MTILNIKTGSIGFGAGRALAPPGVQLLECWSEQLPIDLRIEALERIADRGELFIAVARIEHPDEPSDLECAIASLALRLTLLPLRHAYKITDRRRPDYNAIDLF